MVPPNELNVLDRDGGFTAITSRGKGFRGNTLWRPGKLLKKGSVGVLQEFDEGSFFQNNNNVTMAIYKVKGYPYRVAVWFDNATGNRIA